MNDYCEVYINLRVDALDRPLHYAIPPELKGQVLPGIRVTVPLGSRKQTGLVTEVMDHAMVDNVRPVAAVLDKEPLLNKEMLALADYMTEEYHCRLIDALRLMLPPGLEHVNPAKETLVSLQTGIDGKLISEKIAAKAPRQAQALRVLAQGETLKLKELQANHGIARSVIQRMEQKGLLSLQQRRVWREDCSPGDKNFALPLTLTEDQEQALNEIQQDMKKGGEALLFGVTGSGKTEIYLQAIASCLQQEGQALVLVPEIALTPQMISRFRGRFGGLVAVMHSRLTPAQRLDSWWRIRLGDAPIVLGARSAVFAPLQNLSLIIVDEEHEGSYKQEEPAPRYHARNIARWRCRRHKGALVLGSATPSLEAFYAAQKSGRLLVMPSRINNKQMPPVEVVDMRQELQSGNRTIFSQKLRTALEANVEAGHQTILLINRRGMASFLLCRQCGEVIRCPYCSVSMTLHGKGRDLICHYCSHTIPVPSVCPHCGSHYLRSFGVGTEKVEEEVKKLVPSARVFRLDADTASKRGAHSRILNAFASNPGSVLVGTQMVAKGLDMADVALVGVINADTALNLPDFRASERTFQLLTQVAGRTGRGKDPGSVIVQTYNPEHFAVTTAAAQNYTAFYEQEIKLREMLLYPPFSRLIRLLITSPQEEVVSAEAERLSKLLVPLTEEKQLELMGPVEAPLTKIRGRYRWQIIIKGLFLPPASFWQPVWHEFKESAPKNLRLIVNPDPYSLL